MDGRMDMPFEQKDQFEKLALRALEASRTRLMMTYRFLDRALWRMPLVSSDAAEDGASGKGFGILHEGGRIERYEGIPPMGSVEQRTYALATNGAELRFDPMNVLTDYRVDSNRVLRAFLHSVLHCILRHPFHTVRVEPELWGLACDICVESMAVQLCDGRFTQPEDEQVMRLAQLLEDDGVAAVPGRVYRALLQAQAHPDERPWLTPFAADPEGAGALFARDSHEFWDLSSPRKRDEDEQNDEQQPPQDDGGQPPDNQETDERGENGEGDAPPEPQEAPQLDPNVEQAEHDWQDIAQQVETEMRAHARSRGNDLGRMAGNLELANRSEIDYEDFLRRFCLRSEELKTNQDEFDYIFYTYGLELYGNMPLIEPLEYLEVESLRDFVIAIDTSGSCSGELVRTFLTRTCEILSQAQVKGGETNVFVIQADLYVQSVEQVKSTEDLRRMVDGLQVRGGGGTDFRPVFSYVEELREQGLLENLRGMVYFTDGLGIFPTVVPDYDVAFVFVEDEGRHTYVPPWAMKVVLGRFDIEQLEASARGGAL